MRIDIVNGSVVTGDGESFLEDTSVITAVGAIPMGVKRNIANW